MRRVLEGAEKKAEPAVAQEDAKIERLKKGKTQATTETNPADFDYESDAAQTVSGIRRPDPVEAKQVAPAVPTAVRTTSDPGNDDVALGPAIPSPDGEADAAQTSEKTDEEEPASLGAAPPSARAGPSVRSPTDAPDIPLMGQSLEEAARQRDDDIEVDESASIEIPEYMVHARAFQWAIIRRLFTLIVGLISVSFVLLFVLQGPILESMRDLRSHVRLDRLNVTVVRTEDANVALAESSEDTPLESGESYVVLGPNPEPGLIENSEFGPLPTLGLDGRTPLEVYARPVRGEIEESRIAVLLTDLGHSRFLLNEALRLPGTVTFAFNPYARELTGKINAARENGHEVLLDLPIEPPSYPASDPGPFGLLVDLSPDRNIERLYWLMGRTTGYIGFVARGSGRFFRENERNLTQVLDDIGRRGLMLVDGTSEQRAVLNVATTVSLKVARTDLSLDTDLTRTAIDRQLDLLERRALSQGFAVGIMRGFPLTVSRLQRWIPELERKNIVLVPVSSLAANAEPDADNGSL